MHANTMTLIPNNNVTKLTHLYQEGVEPTLAMTALSASPLLIIPTMSNGVVRHELPSSIFPSGRVTLIGTDSLAIEGHTHTHTHTHNGNSLFFQVHHYREGGHS